ncbi:MAG TPA: sigma-54 dependent transcriptional regulator [Povalibacter sp.]|nr:sigma-54 dependent transcriptional regulator [Povalibacter sp.]
MANTLHALDDFGSSLRAPGALAVTQICGAEGLLGESPVMQELFEQIQGVAAMRNNVLIVGEHGSGKELVARCLHDLSPRCGEPLLVVHCGSLAQELIEAELFGNERLGLVSNAAWSQVGAHPGYFERAGAGTLLLDEITHLSSAAQAKLLRVLESARIPRVGSDREVEIRCRVIASASRDPRDAVAAGRLRPDLLHRLSALSIVVPPLRERGDDVELMARYFLAVLNSEASTSKRLSADSLLCLHQHSWPGNVRELRNAVHRAFIAADAELDLRAAVDQPLALPVTGDEQVLRIPVGTRLADAERWMIIATLKKCGGNKTRAAALLGVSLKTLYNRLNAYRAQGLEVSDIDRELTEVVT